MAFLEQDQAGRLQVAVAVQLAEGTGALMDARAAQTETSIHAVAELAREPPREALVGRAWLLRHSPLP